MIRDAIKMAVKEQTVVRQNSKRCCTDCGKPTTDYRCDACWRKLRGMAFYEAAHCLTEISPLAERRVPKTKPAPSIRDKWVPLAPRPSLPDRQAEFLAKTATVIQE